MFNFEKYNLKEIKDFFIEKAKNSRIEIYTNEVYFIGELSDSILGRGVEKTSFYFREYPELVFKTFIGDYFSYSPKDLKYLYTSFNTENQILLMRKKIIFLIFLFLLLKFVNINLIFHLLMMKKIKNLLYQLLFNLK